MGRSVVETAIRGLRTGRRACARRSTPNATNEATTPQYFAEVRKRHPEGAISCEPEQAKVGKRVKQEHRWNSSAQHHELHQVDFAR